MPPWRGSPEKGYGGSPDERRRTWHGGARFTRIGSTAGVMVITATAPGVGIRSPIRIVVIGLRLMRLFVKRPRIGHRPDPDFALWRGGVAPLSVLKKLSKSARLSPWV